MKKIIKMLGLSKKEITKEQLRKIKGGANRNTSRSNITNPVQATPDTVDDDTYETETDGN